MEEYNLELQFYTNYRNGLDALKDNISRLDKEIDKGRYDLMQLIYDLSYWNECFVIAEGNCKVLISNEINRLTNEKSNQVNYINALKEKLQQYVNRFEHQPRISVPPDNEYEIRNGLLGVERDILLKQTRNPCITDAYLQQIMGMSKGNVGYRSLSFKE
jgi:hypothetical protein